MFISLGSIAAVAQRDESISVTVGKAKTARISKISINFVSVLEDSRCPEGVDCIWAGRARIQVTLGVEAKEAKAVEFSLDGDDNSFEFSGYRVHFSSLNPKPTADGSPKQADYSASFRFEKLGTKK